MRKSIKTFIAAGIIAASAASAANAQQAAIEYLNQNIASPESTERVDHEGADAVNDEQLLSKITQMQERLAEIQARQERMQYVMENQ